MTPKPNGYWNNFERVHEQALKYKDRATFQKKSSSAYNVAGKMGWKDLVCSHMTRLGTKHDRMVYAYEFSDNNVYIGLTFNINKRQQAHLGGDVNSSVFKHMAGTGLIPVLVRITDYVQLEDAVSMEQQTVNLYTSNEWNILNKVKTGGIGGTTKKWTIETLKEEAAKYSSKMDFYRESQSAYNIAYKINCMEEISAHMEQGKMPNGTWNKQTCTVEAQKYKTRTAFFKGSSGAYDYAHSHKILNDVCIHMKFKPKSK